MKTRLTLRLRAAWGLACACAAGFTLTVHAQPNGTNEIAYTDFDTFTPGFSYGYFYSWNVPGTPPEPGTYEFTMGYTDPLLDPTNGPLVYRYAFTNAPYEGPVTTNAAGYGTGFGAPLNWGFDPAVFTSLDLADYLLSWDARVEGLKPGQTTGTCEMQFRLGPDGSRVLTKNINYYPGSNWAHFTFTLEDGGFGDGTTYTIFTNGIVAGVTAVSFNQNQHLPHDQFGFDDDNVIYLDNIKLEVIQYAGPPPPPPPTVPFTILDYNFDDRTLWWSSGGWAWSQNAFQPSGTHVRENPGQGMGGSNAMTIVMDNSTLAPPNTPQWAGTGMNGGGPGDYSRFDSPNLADYRLSFDARVEGLAPDRTNTTLRHQFTVRAPDDTVQPADGDTDVDTLLRLDFDVPAGTNWQNIAYLLRSGVVGSGSKANFSNYVALVSETMIQWQIENANSGADWEFDANNLVAIDNVKLERLYVGCPPLSVQTLGTEVVVSWNPPSSGTAKLQSSATVNGTYTDVLGATSPYTNAISGAPKYFRTQWIAP